MNDYAHKEDCEINRDSKGKALLVDCDGDELFAVPDAWTDEQIWTALRLMNKAYFAGVKVGGEAKSREIRMALECV